MKKAAAAAAAAALAALAGAAAHAQDWTAPPVFGSASLSSGFTPDPNVTLIRAGGSLAASAASPDCRGYVTSAPSFVVRYGGSVAEADLFVSAGSESDTTLVVRGPDGLWRCDDDGGEGLNPALIIAKPDAGDYAVWVGTYRQMPEAPAANLYFSASTFYAGAPSIGGSTGTGAGQPGDLLDPNAAPNFGSISLTGGFSPDPRSVYLRAGGDLNARDMGGGCVGYATRSPDYVVNYSSPARQLMFSVGSGADTTLIVHGPDGRYSCDDDGGASGLNPGLRFDNPRAGAYRVWVGTYSNSGARPATLHVSERGFYDNENTTDATLDPRAPANYGETTLAAGFGGPRTVSLRAGGERSAAGLGGACLGYVTRAPDYRVRYTGAGRPLVIGATSEADLTLVVHGPNGAYSCNDDTNGLNPQVSYSSAAPGEYAIWVGTYSASLGTPEATLSISETGGFGPVTPGPVTPGPVGPGGQVSLTSGFLPDPYTVNVNAGGPVDARGRAGGRCVGYMAEAPSLTLDYTAGSYQLFLSAASSADTTLVVLGPDGRYYCDDDGAGNFNPGVHMPNPSSGRYQIWVGTYAAIGSASARLHVSEIGFQR